MTNTMKEIDTIGTMVYNAELWGMKSITITKPSSETIETIESCGYKVTDLNSEIRITW